MKATVFSDWDVHTVNQIMDMAELFINETDYPVTYDSGKIYDRLSQAFFDDDSDIILSFDHDGNLLGGVLVHAIADWQVEKFGYVEKFFVDPTSRGVGVGRVLAARMAQWFDDKDCVISFATSTANIGRTRQFTNLMAKYGYQSAGPTLARNNSHG